MLFILGAAGSYLLNGMGAILASIQDERGASRAEVGLYPTLFAAGLIVMSFLAARLIARVDRPTALRLSIAGIIASACLLVVPDRAVSYLGAMLMGASGGLMITLTPVIIAALHPRRTVGIFGELQAANSAASVVAPLVIGLALGLGLGWRPAYLLPTVVMVLLLPLLTGIPRARRARHGPDPAPAPRPAAGRGRSMARWLDILISVGAEFCMVFWAASAFRDWHGASDDLAAALTAVFLLGMAAARAVATPVTRAVPEAWRLVTGGSLVALIGFALFWAGPSIWVAAAGAVVVGMGLGLQYPVLLPLFVSGYPEAPDRAAARGALASGLAIGGAPLVLAFLSDRLGLHEAYLIVPLLLVVLAIRVGLRREVGPRSGESAAAEVLSSA